MSRTTSKRAARDRAHARSRRGMRKRSCRGPSDLPFVSRERATQRRSPSFGSQHLSSAPTRKIRHPLARGRAARRGHRSALLDVRRGRMRAGGRASGRRPESRRLAPDAYGSFPESQLRKTGPAVGHIRAWRGGPLGADRPPSVRDRATVKLGHVRSQDCPRAIASITMFMLPVAHWSVNVNPAIRQPSGVRLSW
jgi:hypothetical protein